MHDQAYQAQCRSAEQRHRPGEADRRATLILLALALGTFAIGTGEFGSNGIVQLFADDLDVSVPAATSAVTAYALAVYTFIGPYVTEAAGADEAIIPVALAVFGVGMATGNWLGGRLADEYPYRGVALGYGTVLIFLVLVALGGRHLLVLFPALFGVGATMMMAIPTIQVLLTRYAPEAPTLMGALNLASLNLANALGAIGGAVVLDAGWGTLSTAWTGLVLTGVGLLLFALTVPRVAPPPTPQQLPVAAGHPQKR